MRKALFTKLDLSGQHRSDPNLAPDLARDARVRTRHEKIPAGTRARACTDWRGECTGRAIDTDHRAKRDSGSAVAISRVWISGSKVRLAAPSRRARRSVARRGAALIDSFCAADSLPIYSRANSPMRKCTACTPRVTARSRRDHVLHAILARDRLVHV
jgi:hypothetical protein